MLIGAAIQVHRALGPGLLESAYEACLAFEIAERGLKVERQKTLPIIYREVELEAGYRLDLVVENSVAVELKAVDRLAAIHEAQLISYLKLSGHKVGLLINFNVKVLKEWDSPSSKQIPRFSALSAPSAVDMLQIFRKNRMWRKRPLKGAYDVVIVGAGVHGLSTAYYLGKLGIRNVAVLDKGYLGGGASARSTAIVRANYLTAQGIPFFRESLKLYQHLAQELDFNLLLNQMGRLDIGHTESAVYWLNLRAQFNQLLDVDSRLIGPHEIKEMVPVMDLREGKPLPVMAALYHPPAGVVRHDAVVWGLARGADRLGAEIHPFTEVTGITRENGRVTGVETSKGPHQRRHRR